MSDSIYLIYKHTSPSEKSYIGQTNNYNRRTKQHKNPKSGCIIFSKAIQKYGWDNFTHEILAENISLDDANILEPKFILEHNTLAPNGYNLTTGGLNKSPSVETRLKTSNTSKGRPAHNKGIPMSLIQREQRKGKPAKNKGVPMSINQKHKLSESNNNRKKQIIIDGQLFNSLKEAMNAFNIHRSTLINRLNSPYWNWNYVITNEDDL